MQINPTELSAALMPFVERQEGKVNMCGHIFRFSKERSAEYNIKHNLLKYFVPLFSGWVDVNYEHKSLSLLVIEPITIYERADKARKVKNAVMYKGTFEKGHLELQFRRLSVLKRIKEEAREDLKLSIDAIKFHASLRDRFGSLFSGYQREFPIIEKDDKCILEVEQPRYHGTLSHLKYSFKEKLIILHGACEPVEKMHKLNLAHGDLKGQNVLVVKGHTVGARLNDLEFSSKNYAMSGKKQETPYFCWDYMGNEFGIVSFEGDMFGLARILAECLHGKSFFQEWLKNNELTVSQYASFVLEEMYKLGHMKRREGPAEDPEKLLDELYEIRHEWKITVQIFLETYQWIKKIMIQDQNRKAFFVSRELLVKDIHDDVLHRLDDKVVALLNKECPRTTLQEFQDFVRKLYDLWSKNDELRDPSEPLKLSPRVSDPLPVNEVFLPSFPRGRSKSI